LHAEHVLSRTLIVKITYVHSQIHAHASGMKAQG
jgi:hypothetical protein